MRDSTIIAEFDKVYRQIHALGAAIQEDRTKNSILLRTLTDMRIISADDIKRVSAVMVEELKKEAGDAKPH